MFQQKKKQNERSAEIKVSKIVPNQLNLGFSKHFYQLEEIHNSINTMVIILVLRVVVNLLPSQQLTQFLHLF